MKRHLSKIRGQAAANERLYAWWLAIRVQTLPASIAPILVGAMAAYSQLNWVIFTTCLLCGVALQITVNFANDYFDAQQGIDTPHRLGPKRATASGLISPKHMRNAIMFMLIISSGLGLILIVHGGWPFVFIGLLSLIAAKAYSGGPWPLASHGLGEITVFIFFGLVAVLGSFYLQSKQLTWQVMVLASMMGAVASAIMLVNNLRDIDTDKASAKYTLAVKLGRQHSQSLYVVLLCFPLLAISGLQIIDGGYWWPSLASGVFLPKLVNGIYRRCGSQLNQQLAQTAAWLLILGVSLCITLIISA